MESEDDGPEWIGMWSPPDLPPEELDELDQGRYFCVDCGNYYAPDGEEGHYGCPTPRAPGDYPPGLLPR